MALDKSKLPYRPCVGIVLANEQGLIFAGERVDTPGAWQMPQGGIDEDETPAAAALRELREETGIGADLVRIEAAISDWVRYDLPEPLLGRVWQGKYRGQKQLWYLLRFHGDDTQIQIATDHPEFSRWRWMRASDLIEAIVSFKRELYRTVLGEFSAHLAP
ncbi:MAG: RNA pyrophosphohydrolase [Pseudomonadota bacterium]